MLKVEKILNHNVVLCRDESQRNLIAFGTGIGFNKKSGDSLDEARIVNLYGLKNLARYEKLISETEDQIVSLSEQIIRELEECFSQDFDRNIHVSLLDHLQFSVKRYRENMIVQNVFLDETAYFYPKEFAFAKQALAMVNESLKINLPLSEAGFLCMHIHAALHHEDLSFTNFSFQVMQDILGLIETDLGIDLKQYEDARQRLMTHIRFAIKRSLEHSEIQNDLQEVIQERYVRAFALAKKISTVVQEKYDLSLNEAELAYLSIHLENIIRSIPLV
ncbi:PRD domain protein [Bulleidia extructa W1219]|jgi:Transcriptional antiterminator|uniref:PRD domain protein n=1 Tax=Bulleidia extructa W1219 TaxID=679192 RepID=D2MNU4_9FIRM|nr:PRD domain-containing protein [Bulleidia extructa]EFC05713.1 PRD domain protein [Bulleidia extructa W1219]